jgi:hypothetical protein
LLEFLLDKLGNSLFRKVMLKYIPLNHLNTKLILKHIFKRQIYTTSPEPIDGTI